MWNTCGECSAHSEWLQYVSSERYDKVCLYGVKVCERWYEHKVESVVENDIVKIL